MDKELIVAVALAFIAIAFWVIRRISKRKSFHVLSTRISVYQPVSSGGTEMPSFIIEAKGILPRDFTGGLLSVATSIEDVTDHKPAYNRPLPLYSGMENTQETNSRVFLSSQDLGYIDQGVLYQDWTAVGSAQIPLLEPPHSGERTLQFITRWGHPGAVANIQNGILDPFVAKYGGLNASSVTTFTYNFPQEGYLQRQENEIRCTEISIILAMNVAITGNELHDAEGRSIQQFAGKFSRNYTGGKREKVKARMNMAIREGFEKACLGNINVQLLTEELGEIGAETDKYELMQLLVDVMSSDSLSHRHQLDLINNIGARLGVNFANIAGLRESAARMVDGPGLTHENLEVQLAIDSTLSNEEILRYIREQFIRWNGRYVAVSDKSTKVEIEERLNLLAEAKRKYEFRDAA